MDNVIAWCSGSPSIYPFYWIDPAAPNARELGVGGAALEGVYRTGLQRYLFGGDNAQRKVPTPDGHEIDKNKVLVVVLVAYTTIFIFLHLPPCAPTAKSDILCTRSPVRV